LPVEVEITDLEENPKEKETQMEQQEVPKEENAVKRVIALKKRYGERHLAVGRPRKPKKQTQGNSGSRKKLAAACRGMTHSTISARRKGHCCQGQGKNKDVS
jgi:hypothetical protein